MSRDCSPRRAAQDGGAGGVLAIAIVAATMLAAMAVLTLCAVLSARHRVVAAADAAALAAADAVLGVVPGAPCAWAEKVAASHRVAFVDCVVEGAEVVVSLRVDLAGLPVGASSRAGPAQ
jgi:secretion/DNA translocation related TadE-like protein